MKTTINIRVDKKLKSDSQAIFEEFGFDMTTAIIVYLKAVVRTNSIPFEFEIPSEKLLKSMQEAKDILLGKVKAKAYKSSADLRKDLGI